MNSTKVQTKPVMSGRDVYKNTLVELIAEDSRIYCIECDLASHNHPVQKYFPENFINLGIAEMAGVDTAVAFSESGLVPFISSFASFISLRAAESIKLGLGYKHANVNIVATYAGASGAWFGPTHHCLEDMAIPLSLPNIIVAAPVGEAETIIVIKSAAKSNLPWYIKMGRNEVFENMQNPLVSNFDRSCAPAIGSENRVPNCELVLISFGEKAAQQAQIAINEHMTIVHFRLREFNTSEILSSLEPALKLDVPIIVIEEHRKLTGVAAAIAISCPGSEIYAHACNDLWPKTGGNHDDILEILEFTYEKLSQKISQILN